MAYGLCCIDMLVIHIYSILLLLYCWFMLHSFTFWLSDHWSLWSIPRSDYHDRWLLASEALLAQGFPIRTSLSNGIPLCSWASSEAPSSSRTATAGMAGNAMHVESIGVALLYIFSRGNTMLSDIVSKGYLGSICQKPKANSTPSGSGPSGSMFFSSALMNLSQFAVGSAGSHSSRPSRSSNRGWLVLVQMFINWLNCTVVLCLHWFVWIWHLLNLNCSMLMSWLHNKKTKKMQNSQLQYTSCGVCGVVDVFSDGWYFRVVLCRHTSEEGSVASGRVEKSLSSLTTGGSKTQDCSTSILRCPNTILIYDIWYM